LVGLVGGVGEAGDVAVELAEAAGGVAADGGTGKDCNGSENEMRRMHGSRMGPDRRLMRRRCLGKRRRKESATGSSHNDGKVRLHWVASRSRLCL